MQDLELSSGQVELYTFTELRRLETKPDVTQRTCVISLESSTRVETSYFIPPSMDEMTMMTLEFLWGIPYGSFDHTIASNIINLTPELRRLFDSGHWALLPLDYSLLRSLIGKRFTLQQPVETHYKGVDTFDYVFLPLPGMDITITRMADNHPQEHLLPYTSLPILQLKVYPHFVVFNTVKKLLKHEESLETLRNQEGYEQVYQLYSGCDTVSRCIYNCWVLITIPLNFPRDTVLGEDSAKIVRRRPTAMSFLSEDPASVWDGDEVGLYPGDSISCTSGDDEADNADDDDGDDECPSDETDSKFESRMRSWVLDVLPGLMHASQHPPPDSSIVDDMYSDFSYGSDQGSPTMVGSVDKEMEEEEVEVALGKDSVKRTLRYDLPPFNTQRKALSDMSVDSSTYARAHT